MNISEIEPEKLKLIDEIMNIQGEIRIQLLDVAGQKSNALACNIMDFIMNSKIIKDEYKQAYEQIAI